MYILPEYAYDPDRVLAKIPFTTFLDEEAIKKEIDNSEALQQFIQNIQSPKFTHEPEGIVGSGPYKLVKWEDGQEIVLEKKENWWGDALAKDHPLLSAYPDRLVYKPIPNGATALSALKAEDLDVMGRIDPKDFVEIKEDEWFSDHYNLFEQPNLVIFLLYLNNQNPKLNDKRVRKALAHAMDVDAIIENVYYGYGRRVNGPTTPEFSFYNKELPPVNYDIEKSKNLLEEAGWQDSNDNGTVDKMIDGQLTELNLSVDYVAGRETTQTIFELMQNMMKSAGLIYN